MDSHRFDAITRQFSVLRSRRDGIFVLLTGLAAGALGLPAATEAAHCQSKGQPCDKNEDCCSRSCLFPGFRQQVDRQAGQEGRAGPHEVAAERRRRKGKRGKKCKRRGNDRRGRVGQERQNCKRGGNGKGTCLCSRLEARCNVSGDCCFEDQLCTSNGCDEHTVCCKKEGAPCEDDCDCCGERSFCDEESGTCQDCGEKKLTQEGPCTKDEDCCFDEDVCGRINPFCETREEYMQCCAPGDAECEETCDCCAPLFCDPDLGKCVVPGSLCPPDEVACLIANPKKECCPEDFGECCHESKPFGCCATGFPTCCDHTKTIVVDGQPVEIGCCLATQVCCPREADILCASSLAECGVV